MKEKEFNEFLRNNDINPRNDIADFARQEFKGIIRNIHKKAFVYEKCFREYCYKDKILSKYNEDAFSATFFCVYNNLQLCEYNATNAKLSQFLIVIASKIIREISKGKDAKFIVAIAKYLKEIKQIENLFLYFAETRNIEVYKVLKSIEMSIENSNRIRNYLNLVSNCQIARTIIKTILSHNSNDESYLMLSQIFKWNFNENLFVLSQYDDYANDEIYIMENTIREVENMIKMENEEYQNEKKKKIFCGLLIHNYFRTNFALDLFKQNFSIDFAFKFFKSKTAKVQTLLSFENNTEEQFSLYIDANGHMNFAIKSHHIVLKYNKLIANKTYHINFKFYQAGYFSNAKIIFTIDDVQSEYENREGLNDDYILTIGKFNGIISDIRIENIDDSENSYLTIDTNLIYENYICNPTIKEYDVITTIKADIKLLRIDNSEKNSCFDIPFKHKFTADEFCEANGLEYFNLMLCELMRNVENNDNSNDDIEKVYNICYGIFNIVFNLLDYNNAKFAERISQIMYSFSVLAVKINAKCNVGIPEKLVDLFANKISGLNNNNFANKIFMLILNPMWSRSDERVIDIFIKNIDRLLLIDQNCINYYIELFCEVYKNTRNKKVINVILSALLRKAKPNAICEYMKKALHIALNEHNNLISYKMMKALYLHANKDAIINCDLYCNDIIKDLFAILFNEAENNDKFAYANKFIAVRIIDEFYIKKLIKNTKITYSANSYEENEYSIAIKCIEKIICRDVILNDQIMRSIILIAFISSKPKSSIKFIKQNKIEFSCDNIIADPSVLIAVFSVIDQLYENDTLRDDYYNFISLFIDDILNKIANKVSSAVNLFKSQKILGEIFFHLIANAHTHIPIEYITKTISKSIYSHSDPFYFKLILRLIEENAIRNDDHLFAYIDAILQSLISHMKDATKEHRDMVTYRLNTKNLFFLFYQIFSACDINSENNKSIREKIFESFCSYLQRMLKSPLLYTRTQFDRKSNLTCVFDTFCEYYRGSFASATHSKLISEVFFPKWIKKNEHSVLFYIDKAKKKSNILNEAMKYEKDFIALNEGSVNTYHYIILFLMKITFAKIRFEPVVEDNCVNAEFVDFLNKMETSLLHDVNANITKVAKIHFENSDKKYNAFKANIILRLNNKEKVTSEFLANIISDFNANNKSMASSSIGTNSANVVIKSKFDTKDIIDILSEKKVNAMTKRRKNFSDLIINADLWYEDIGYNGIFAVYKTKNYFYKNIFAKSNIDVLYRDEYFKAKIVNEYAKYNFNDAQMFINRFTYPTKIKNYITKSHMRPFVKLNRKFYSFAKFTVSHSYMKGKAIKAIMKEEKRRKMIYDKANKFECELITNEGAIYAKVYLGKNFIVIKNAKKCDFVPNERNLFSSQEYIKKDKFIIIPYMNIIEVLIRQFLHYWQACEIFLKNGKSYFINFFQNAKVKEFFSKIKHLHNVIPDSKGYFNSLKAIERWKSGDMSTFDFLNVLNKYSGRTYCDLNQYPIFPWIFANYESIDKMNNNEYRDFSYPISLQLAKKRNTFSEQSSQSQDFINDITLYQTSHQSVHYSISAFIYFFLVRLSPITETHIEFQSGSFDNPGRMFEGIAQTKRILQKFKDNRELIPEFYYLKEMFHNVNLCTLGIKQGKIISDVILPENCINSSQFVYLNRKGLESKFVCENINKWLDNIFGCYNKYIGRNEKNMKFNLFQWHTYEDAVKEKFARALAKENGREEVISDICFIHSFGQAPTQMFTEPSPRRIPPKESNISPYLVEKSIKNNLLSTANTKSGYNYIVKFNLNFEDSKEVIKTVYYTDNNVFIITSDKLLYMYSIIDYTKQTRIYLGETFTYLTSKCIQHCDKAVIVANYTDKALVVYVQNAKKQILPTLDVISCLSPIYASYIWTGSIRGVVTKYEIKKSKDTLYYALVKASPCLHSHNSNSIVTNVIYNENLNVIISIASDNKIIIRNASMYEMLNAIKLNNANSHKEIMMNAYDDMFIFDNKKNVVTMYTINGMRICDWIREANSERSVIVEGNRFFFFDNENDLLFETAEYAVDHITSQYKIEFKDKNDRIKKMKFVEKQFAFDFFESEGYVHRFYLKKKSGITKKNKNATKSQNDKKESSKLSFLTKALSIAFNE